MVDLHAHILPGIDDGAPDFETSIEMVRELAAIGITENSDAVAITVSEENGVISVARDGKLTRFLDEKGLEKILLSLYLDESAAESAIGKFLRLGSKEEPRKEEGGPKDA